VQKSEAYADHNLRQSFYNLPSWMRIYKGLIQQFKDAKKKSIGGASGELTGIDENQILILVFSSIVCQQKRIVFGLV